MGLLERLITLAQLIELAQTAATRTTTLEITHCLSVGSHRDAKSTLSFSLQLSFDHAKLRYQPGAGVAIEYESNGDWERKPCSPLEMDADKGITRCSLSMVRYMTYQLRLAVQGNNATEELIPYLLPWTPEIKLPTCQEAPNISEFTVVGTSMNQLNISWRPSEPYDAARYGKLSASVSLRTDAKGSARTVREIPDKCHCRCLFAVTGLTPCTSYEVCIDVNVTHARGRRHACLRAKTSCASSPVMIPVYASVGICVALVALLAALACSVWRRLGKRKALEDDEDTDALVAPRNSYDDAEYRHELSYQETKVIAASSAPGQIRCVLIGPYENGEI